MPKLGGSISACHCRKALFETTAEADFSACIQIRYQAEFKGGKAKLAESVSLDAFYQ
ncbi:MAG TPA: hypothetical protein VJ732_00945 [Bryobacteraceae bacterium]|nr:hypothetical protein [Bryobacteraceae bacterium]